MRPTLRHSTVSLLSLLLIVSCAPGQEVLRFRTPDATYTINRNDSSHEAPSGLGATIPLWNGSFDFEGTTYPFIMVGSDPSVSGAGTTDVPAVMIPIRVKFGNTVISPTQKACGDSVSVLSRVRNSPLFNSQVTWTAGTTVLGKTQYTDAFQRANFWNSVNSISPKYHVLLKPVVVTPVQTIDVPPSNGYAEPGLCSGHPLGVDIPFWSNATGAILQILNVQPTTVAIFVFYDIGMTPPPVGGNAKPLEAIGMNTYNDQTFVAASYIEPNAFVSGSGGISVLSSMLALWLDDPLIFNNVVPPWGPIPGTKSCDGWLAVSSPLYGTTFPVVQNGVTYNIQEPAFLSWFARQRPSTAVNGWYSLQNTLTTRPPICQ